MKLRNWLSILIVNVIVAVAIIGACEVFLRVFWGYPRGVFLGWTPGEGGLYPENSEILMPGPIPYTVKTNSMGFRGDSMSELPGVGTIRIAAIGDSITDGFFVDNEHTYPYLLQRQLRTMGWQVEVLNAARGGGSIDKELEIFSKRVVPLRPNVVVLTFVTNDISDIAGKPLADLISPDSYLKGSDGRKSGFLTFISKTAIGEFFYETYLSWLSPAYRQITKKLESPEDRYRITGGKNFRDNSRVFSSRFKNTDGLVLTDPIAPQVHTLLENYLILLAEFNRVCEDNGIELLFVYFPAYPQIYDNSASDEIQRILSDHVSTLGIRFLDLTPVFRENGPGKILHLAPLDFHPNPDGNKVMANEIADFLANNMLDDLRTAERR